MHAFTRTTRSEELKNMARVAYKNRKPGNHVEVFKLQKREAKNEPKERCGGGCGTSSSEVS